MTLANELSVLYIPIKYLNFFVGKTKADIQFFYSDKIENNETL